MNYFGRALFFTLLYISVGQAGATSSSCAPVTKTIIVNAPLSRVWEAIRAERLSDPAHRHVISHSGCEYEVEERFDKLPVIGTVNCVYSEHEVDRRKVEYKLISSDKFLAFEGSWQLMPCPNGKTTVTLTSFADTGMHIPFASKMTRTSTSESVDKRLSELEKSLEPKRQLPSQ